MVRVYDSGQDGDIYYLVMEYVAGGTCKSLLASHDGPLSVDLAVSIVRDVAGGLQEAARHGVIHRDIKPENIRLTVDGRAKLADLGIAKIADPVGLTEMTATGIAMCTPLYISPEQIRNPKTADCRSDIYSLGATFFEFLTGVAPFDDESAFSVLEMHIQAPIPDARARNGAVSPALAAIVTRALAKNPDERFQSATTLLAAIGDDIPQTAMPLPPAALRPTPTPLPAPTASDLRSSQAVRTPQWKVGLLVAAVVLLGIAAFAILARKAPATASPPPEVVVQPPQNPSYQAPDPKHALPPVPGKRVTQPPHFDANGMWLITLGPIRPGAPGTFAANERWSGTPPILKKGKVHGFAAAKGTVILRCPLPPGAKAFKATVATRAGHVNFRVESSGRIIDEVVLSRGQEHHFSLEFETSPHELVLISKDGLGFWCNPTVFNY